MRFFILKLPFLMAGFLAMGTPTLHAQSSTLLSAGLANGQTIEQPNRLLNDSCRAAFEALRSDNFAAFAATLPTDAEFGSIVKASMQGLSPEQLSRALEEFEDAGGAAGIRSQALQTLKPRIHKTHQLAAQEFDWAIAEYVGAIPPSRAAQPVGDSGFSVTPIDFVVAANGQLWTFGANDVLVGPRGYSFTEFLSFRGQWTFKGWTESEVQEALMNAEMALSESRMKEVEANMEVNRLQAVVAKAEVDASKAQADADAGIQAQADAQAKVHSQIHAEATQEVASLQRKIDELNSDKMRLRDKIDALEQDKYDLISKQKKEEEKEDSITDYALQIRDVQIAAQANALRILHQHVQSSQDPATPALATQVESPFPWAPEIKAGAPWTARLALALSTPVSNHYGSMTREAALRYLETSSTFRIVFTQSLPFVEHDVEIEFGLDKTLLGTALEDMLGRENLAAIDGVLFVGTPEVLAELRRRDLGLRSKQSSDFSASEVSLRNTFEEFDYEAASVQTTLENITMWAEVPIWITQSASNQMDPLSIETAMPENFSAWTHIQILCSYAAVRCTSLDGVMVVSSESDRPIALPKLSKEVQDRVAGMVADTNSWEESLEGCLVYLTDTIDVTLKAEASVLRKFPGSPFSSSETFNMDAALLLQLIQYELKGTFWTLEDDMLHLRLAK